MKKLIFLILLCFYTSIFFAEEQHVIIHPFLKDGYGESYVSYKYIFDSKGLSNIYIEKFWNGTASKDKFTILREPNFVSVFQSDGTLILKATRISDNEFYIERVGSKNKFLVTQVGKVLFAGIQNDLENRLLKLTIEKESISLIFNNKKAAGYNWPFVDFSINLRGKEAFLFFNSYPGLYEKNSHGELEFVSKDNPDELPAEKYQFYTSEEGNGQYKVVDFFIDYFIGSKFTYPIIYTVLLKNWLINKSIGFF